MFKWMVVPVLTLSLASCGDEKSPTASTPPPPPPMPAASIQATGNGAITFHPSTDRRYCCALKHPVQFSETAGGTATWNTARLVFVGEAGETVEAYEVGAAPIRAMGLTNIAARTTYNAVILARTNLPKKAAYVLLTLTFTDKKDGRRFDVDVDTRSFDDVVFDPVPAFLPEGVSAWIERGR